MAIYHLTVRCTNRSDGKSVKSKADYVMREGRYGKDKGEVLYASYGNMPSWVGDDPNNYFKEADTYERKNARLCREIEFALPVELNLRQQQALVEQFAEYVTGKEKLPYIMAIHRGQGHNPHCHLVVNEKANDGIERDAKQWFSQFNPNDPAKGGAKKIERLKSREWLIQTRETWAKMANLTLEKAGRRERIDHRSLEAQGVSDRLQGIHVGPDVQAMELRGVRTDRGDRIRQQVKTGERLKALMAERARLKAEIKREVGISDGIER